SHQVVSKISDLSICRSSSSQGPFTTWISLGSALVFLRSLKENAHKLDNLHLTVDLMHGTESAATLETFNEIMKLLLENHRYLLVRLSYLVDGYQPYSEDW